MTPVRAGFPAFAQGGKNGENKRRKDMRKWTLLTVLLILFCLTAPVYAFNQPLGINLGFTNFLDGASPGPGWYWTEYLQRIRANDLKGSNGHTLFDDANLDAFVILNQLIYQSDVDFLGGNPGIDVILPLVAIEVDPGTGPFPLSAQDGVGDILVGPFMQWGPHMLFDRPYFHRVELQVTAPTGKNSDRITLNPGADVWSFNPYYTFTYFLTPKLSMSSRIHYLWTSENHNTGPGPMNPDFQAGQAIHLNYAMAYAVSDTLRLGVAGYYLRQLEEDEQDGHDMKNSEEEVFAVGPGLVWHLRENLTFMGAINWELRAENRPEGVRSTLRLIWKFW
jgi:hypothetical protein